MWGEGKPLICSSQYFPSYITRRHWCMMVFEFCIMWEVWGWLLGSVFNFTGLRNSKFTGNTDHLAQACHRPDFSELSPDLLTTSSWPLNRWGCQGEHGVPEGGFAVIDQWNSDSASPARSYGITSVCAPARACCGKFLQWWVTRAATFVLYSQFDQTTITPLFAQIKRNCTRIRHNPITAPLLSL